MDIFGWIQLVLFVAVLLLLTKPMGIYLFRVLEPGEKTILPRVFGRVETFLYKIIGIDKDREQNWKEYGLALGLFSIIGLFLTYFILRFQNHLPLNPQHFGAVKAHLAFNTAVSFATNTNWQSYAGETTMSHFSQMVALTFQNFISAAVGIAVAAALVRGIARHRSQTIGNFWVDLVRTILYILLPLSLILALFFVSQGVIQNLNGDVQVTTVTTLEFQAGKGGKDGKEIVQTIPQGPVASQEAIKILGTNGGGFFNANSAHPYENPTPLSNFIQVLAIFLIPSGLTYYLGQVTKNKKHGWSVWTAMALLFLAAVLVCWYAEAQGNSRFETLGLSTNSNMEGKEVRFGVFNSALYATVTTDASCGAVNSMHDSFTPLGGLVTLIDIQLGEVVFGGVGSGLYGMLIFIILAVFLAGLMVGRTPEYLGKKIDIYDVKLCVFIILVTAFFILGPAAWAVSAKWGVSQVNNAGPHGLSEILYAFSSAAGNNGSAFAGLATNTPVYNIILGLVMIAGRFLVIVPVLALAGNMAKKKLTPPGSGSFPVHGLTFIILLVGTVIIVGLLTFLPALSLGPVAEHFLMTGSNKLF
ncbi:MAG: potassium-transporting ATPase potassium-binding subunit [Acidobacteriota bacterium]|nr:potassium-transporting ATPase potassium-binding subunit [Acidobacteriota bacterium]